MAEINYMWIALVMGLFLIASVTIIDTVRERRRKRSDRSTDGMYELAIADQRLSIERASDSWGQVRTVANNPNVWTLTFVVLTAVLTIAGIMFVGGFGIPEEMFGMIQPIIFGFLGLLIAGYLILGTWVVARRRGHPFAHALAETLSVVGLLIILLIAARLIAF